ncbi:MAG: DNA repair protein RecN [Rhodobacteraceae bacterium]|nr:DNA repair protein RecN [Paracoccaceae bacterium]
MLRSLDIRDLLLIEALTVEFRPGLNVLTGETGAGKSILLDCLGAVLGWPGRADLLRRGAEGGEATAVFDLPPEHPAREVLAEAGLPAGEELVLRRTVAADGRRGAFVNDRRASAETLRSLGERLVELHGQHDDTGLLDPRGHRRLLDDFAGAAGALAAVREAWGRLQAARRAEAAAAAALEAGRREEDFLRFAVEELERLAPRPGEEAELDQRRRLMQAGLRIREDIARAVQALGPEGAEGLIGDARRRLAGAAARAEGLLDAPLAALERTLTELGEATDGIARALEALDHDPRALEAAEERLFAIRAAARKHGVAADDLAGLARALGDRLAALESGDAQVRALAAEAAAAGAAHGAACRALGDVRRAAAARLDAAMAAELPPLRLERARFVTGIEPAEAGPEGADAVRFRVATGPGAPPGPIERIASGGELSRFLLALKVCLAAGGSATMIFDEIDRGVGGATADAVGRRLARLAAAGGQVIVVTHSPQVAARAAHHWRVEKRMSGETVTSAVVALDAAARIDEIARMLAGDRVTEAARAAARALVEG